MALALRAAFGVRVCILQTQSRSDIRDPVTLHFDALHESHWVPLSPG